MKKILYVVLDGLGDLAIAELDDKTPLEAAYTPHLDRLAQLGRTGIVYPVAKGIAPESDVAVICLLGYDAHKYYTGRGPLESFAEGLKFKTGDLALRVNFATVEEDGLTIKDRRVGRNLTTEEASSLAREINEKVKLTDAEFEFKNTIGHRGVLVIRSKKMALSGWISNTDPAYAREGVFGVAKDKFENKVALSVPLSGYENSASAQEAARLLNEFTLQSQKVLFACPINQQRIKEGRLPANVILSRDAGDALPNFPSLESVFGVRFGSFVQMPVEKGIALLTGIEVIDVGLPSGEQEKDYQLWAEMALDKINHFDGLYIHIKGPDEPAHDGNFLRKKENIEVIDRCFFGYLLERIDRDQVLIAVTADHSTSCRLKAHTADPVPLLLSGAGISPDGSMSFSEKTARDGSLGELLGYQLMPLLIEFSRRQ